MNLTLREALILYVPMTVGVIVFGILGIYGEVFYVQGMEAANKWLLSMNIKYPEGMLSSDGYQPFGNYVGILLGIVFGWAVAKLIDVKKWF